MAELKDKVVTVESMKALHDYDEATYVKNIGGDITGSLRTKGDWNAFRVENAAGTRQGIFELDPNDGTAQIHAYKDGNNSSTLFVGIETSPNEELLKVRQKTNGVSEVYNVLHTGNKPIRTYTGDGSTTKRTMTIGGIGFTCMISGYGYMALVTNCGAIVKKGDSTTINALTYNDITYNNGVLTISTDSEYVNASNQTYYYQVL